MVERHVVDISSIDPCNRLVQGIDTSKSYSNSIYKYKGVTQNRYSIAYHFTCQFKVGRPWSWSIGMETGYKSSHGQLERRYVSNTIRQE